MRSALSILMLICLVSAVHFQPGYSSSNRASGFKLKHLFEKGFDGHHGKHFGGTDVISSRKFGLGIKSVLLKPLLLVALAKIKLALLFGKPLVLLTLKKLLLDVVLGKLLLKIPLILLGAKALVAKVLALKFALIAKGLIGLKAPLVLLFLGGFLKGALKGTGLGLAIAGSLLKLHDHGSSAEEYDEPYYALPPPPPSYGAPLPYSSAPSPHPVGPLPYSSAPPSYSSAPAPAPAYSAPDSLYSQGFDASNLGHSGIGGGYDIGRKKRNAEERNDDSEEEVEDSDEDFSDESPEDLKLEFEAARTNGNAYLYMAAQFDEQSCGRRLMCEVYQKPQGSVTEDELILQDIFGYPLPPLNEEDEGTPKEMYYRAAQLGASHQGRPNSQICARFFATCPHNSEQLIDFFVNDDSETNEIDDNRPVSHLQPPQQSTVRLPFYHPREPNISPAQQRKPIIVRPAAAKQHPQTIKPTQEQLRRPTVAAAPLTKRILAAPAA